MKYSFTYIAVILLASFTSYLGVEVGDDQLDTFVNVGAAILLGSGALVGRYRAGGVTWFGTKDKRK